MSTNPKPNRNPQHARGLHETEPHCQGFILNLRYEPASEMARKGRLSKALEQMAAILGLRVLTTWATELLVCECLAPRQAPASRTLMNMRRNYLLLWALNQSGVDKVGVTGVFDALDPAAEPRDDDSIRWYQANNLSAECAHQRAAWSGGSSAEMLAGLRAVRLHQSDVGGI